MSCHGYFWVSGQQPKRTWIVPLQSWCTGPYSQFLELLLQTMVTRQTTVSSCSVCEIRCANWHLSLPLDMAPPPHPCQLSFNGPNWFSSVEMPAVPKVIESGPKTFKVDIGGRTEIITIDRLKLAHLDVDSPIQVA